MSTLKVTTIQDTSGGNASTSEQIAQGRAKSWVSFVGTGTVSINDSFNVSSITDSGTGKYIVNMSTAMANINYAVVCDGRYNTSDAAGSTKASTRRTVFTTTTYGIRAASAGGSFDDMAFLSGVVFGD